MTRKEDIILEYRQKNFVKNEFDRTRGEFAFHKKKHSFETKIISDAINAIKKDKIRILDVACGTGRLLSEIIKLDKNIEYTGLDTSRVMFAELKKKANKMKKGSKIKLVLADAEKMPFKDNSFDLVFTYHLLWHIPQENQKKVIKEMIRVTDKGGITIIDTINKGFFWRKIKPFLGLKNDPEMYTLSYADVKKIVHPVSNERRIARIYKLFDVPIKNKQLFAVFNIINKAHKILPRSLFHMVYYGIKK